MGFVFHKFSLLSGEEDVVAGEGERSKRGQRRLIPGGWYGALFL